MKNEWKEIQLTVKNQSTRWEIIMNIENFIYLLYTHTLSLYGLIRISNFLFLRFLSLMHAFVQSFT